MDALLVMTVFFGPFIIPIFACIIAMKISEIHDKRKQESTITGTCENCGAPLTAHTCRYCGVTH